MVVPSAKLAALWRSTRGCEQLQGDVVGVAERQGRAVVGVGDPAVGMPSSSNRACQSLSSARSATPNERWSRPGAVLVEAVALVAGGRGVLVEGEEGAAGELVDGVVVAGGVFVRRGRTRGR